MTLSSCKRRFYGYCNVTSSGYSGWKVQSNFNKINDIIYRVFGGCFRGAIPIAQDRCFYGNRHEKLGW